MYTHIDTHMHKYIQKYIIEEEKQKYFLFLGVCVVKEILMCICCFLYQCLRSYHSNHHFQDKRLHDLFCMEIHLSALICSPLGSDHRSNSQKSEPKEIQPVKNMERLC